MKALVAFASLILAALTFVLISIAIEGPRFEAWCAEQGGQAPYGWINDPTCIRDGLVLIPPKDSNARWPE